MKGYHSNIFSSEEGGGYVAAIRVLDAYSAFGEIPEQALTELERAKEAWLTSAREAGKPIPAPGYCPVICQTSRELSATPSAWRCDLRVSEMLDAHIA
jgi:predicted RNase H-like HicB family nuclease